MRRSRAAVVGWQVAILVIGLSIWEWGWDVARATLPKPWVPKILDPYFISKPSAIWRSFLRLGCLADRVGFAACWRENGNNLWLATLVTLKNMCWGFLWGASFGALIFGTVQMGIFYTGVNTDWFKVFLGVMMLIAVLFNNYIRRKVTEAR